jgi:non-heme chloroperoxidase
LLETIHVTDLAVTTAIPEAPTRPPILFIHGILGGPWYFENYQRFFAARGYPSYAVSLRGRPGSRTARDLGRISLEEFVTDALDVARTLGRPIVVGHSMGGLVAQRLAEEGVTDIAVLLSSASPRGIPLATPRLVVKQVRHLRTLLRSRPLIAGDAEADDLIFSHIPAADRPALRARLVPDSGRAARELSLGTVRVDERRVGCAMLVGGGLEDRFVAPRVARALATKYGAPCWQYPRHGHFLPMEPGWDVIAGDVESWIGRQIDHEQSTR